MNSLLSVSIAGSLMALSLPTLFANIIVAGQTSTPDAFAVVSGLTLLASTPVLTVDPAPGASFDATYVEYVYEDTGGVSGAGLCTGCLDFFIVLTNSGPGVIEHVTTSLSPGYSAFTTDVGVNSSGIVGGPTAGGLTPLDVDRSSDGAVVDFNYGSNNMLSGQTTASLEIQTNATNFMPGTVSVQDGVSGFSLGFAPSSAAPEPSTLALVGFGLIGLGLTKFKLRKKTDTA